MRMTEEELQAIVAKQRACSHMKHYRDRNGNRRCLDCRAFVRRKSGAAMCAAPEDDQ